MLILKMFIKTLKTIIKKRLNKLENQKHAENVKEKTDDEREH